MRNESVSWQSVGFVGALIGCAVVISVAYVFLVDQRGYDERLAAVRAMWRGGKVAESREELLALLDKYPSQPDPAELLAELALAEGNVLQGIEWFQRVPESARERAANARFRGAQLAMQLGRATLVESLSLDAIRLNPLAAEPRRLLLRYYFVLLQHRPLVEQSVALDAQGHTSVTDLAMRCIAHRASWDDDGHIGWLEQCLRQEPDNAVVRAALARNYGQRDRNAEAWGVLDAAPDGNRPHWQLRLARAEQQIVEGRLELAAQSLAELPAEADRESRTWLARASVWSGLGGEGAAATAWTNVITLDPYDPTPSYALSRIQARQGNREEAAELAGKSQHLKELMAALSRLMEASNPAYHPEEPVEQTVRRARESFARLGFGREAEILAQAVGNAQPSDSSTAVQPRLTAKPLDKLVALDRIQGIPDIRSPSAPAHAVAGEPADDSTQRHIHFQEIAPQVGLTFHYDTGRSQYRWIMETLGGGVAVLDFDLDGWDDLYLSQAGPLPISDRATSAADRLFQNRQATKAHEVSRSAGLDDRAYGQGCAVGDYDNDGFPDLIVCNYGQLLVYRNLGDGTFEDAGASSGITSSQWSSSAAFADLDRDGDLDLYVVQYLDARYEQLKPCQFQGRYTSCRPFGFAGTPDMYWINQGDGRFTDGTTDMGLVAADGKGLGVAIVDFAGSGRESIFVANDTTANFLFRPATGSFGQRYEETGMLSGVAVNRHGLTEACMGIATGDVDGDGRFDLFVTNFQGETNTLYLAGDDDQFTDATERAGLADSSRNRTGFGCQFLDVDCDGQLDLFVANGQLHEIAQLPQLYYNVGRGRFREISTSAGPYFREPRLGRSVALLDWNRDLRTDLAVTYQEGNVSLLDNQTDGGHRLSLRFIGVESNRDAVGTRIRARIGDQTRVFYVSRGGGYYAANDPSILIGCGSHDRIDHLEVTWPTGTVESWEHVPAGTSWLVLETTHQWVERPK